MVQGSLAHKLRVLRAERGLTLREAASLTGVAKETISDIERSLRHPHDPTIAKIAKGYGVPVDELLEEPVPLPEAPKAGPADDRKGPDPDIWGEDEDRPKPAMPGTAGHQHQVDIREDDQGTEVTYTRRSFLDLYREIRAGKIAEDEAVKRFQRLADEESKHSA
jgi:transcriptional regulator with XRE-family HTH domain